MFTFLSILYVLVCAFLILVVLLQSGKGGGMGAAFGGTSQTVFGGAGAGNILTRLTAVSAALFMLLSATLAYMSSSSAKALERASEDLQKKKEAISGSSDEGGDTEEPDPAGMSVADEGGDPEGEEAAGQPAAEGETGTEGETGDGTETGSPAPE